VAEEEVVVAVDAAAEGVLDGEHGAVGDPELDGLEGDLELVAGDGVAARVRLAGGGLAVRARHALVRDAQLAAVHRRWGEVADAERALQVGHRDQIQLRRRRRLVHFQRRQVQRLLAVQLRPVAAAAGVLVAGGEDGAGGMPVGAAEWGGVEARGSANHGTPHKQVSSFRRRLVDREAARSLQITLTTNVSFKNAI
jgi:hypothetical protein